MGKRYVRYWSVQDVVTVRAVKALRAAGCPLQRVREVQEQLDDKWNANIASAVLFWDGRDVLKVEDQGEIVSVLNETGQQLTLEVVHVMTFPLRIWIEQALSVAHEVDLEELADARRRRETAQFENDAPPRLEFEDAFRVASSAR
jgi:DNA-binding transcriptional MerR regulator